ncbi:hypothetical protein HN51_046604 [Arachis hypogaea]|uniref:Uncharacterized protein n=1 Tax=Arachis hypogaea TaxID=3818 RepID=A0A445ADG1_ARAHY|nr:putative UPF0481 protein At3g02645 [Arachis ipaensis]XP_025632027.1 putative UPF0481 protein At3g02645 [Arachis hypogaea]RYR24438.1 hypothetical protein Ahy_B02g057937 [Arachis hypogaea]
MTTATTDATDSTLEMVKHVIDVEDLEEELTPISDVCMIYTVPSKLRKMDEEAFTPQWISIGPIHFDKEELKGMQKLKYRYLLHFWKRVSNDEAMKKYKCFLESQVQTIRQSYAQKFPEISNEKFVEIVLLDAVFIVEHFLSEWEFEHRCMLTNHITKGIQRDLLLLENQLPLYVLEELYHKVATPCKDFHELTHHYFGSLYLYAEYSKRDNKAAHHFVDFVRRCCLPEWSLELFIKQENLQVSASKLYEAGVSFECVGDRRLIDITFKMKKPFNGYLLCLGCLPSWFKSFKALLMFPRLKVDKGTICVLKNLMAFEQDHYSDEPFITNYVSLLDSLIHTKEDVELLVEKGCIFREQVSNKEVVNLVKSLSKHVVSSKTCYYKVIRELTLHNQSGWKKTMGTVRRVYFRDTWRGSSTIIGIFVLIFTIVSFYRNIHALISK